MSIIRRLSAGLFAVLLFISTGLAASKEAAVELRKLDDSWSALAEKRDGKAVAAYYADDCTVMAPGMPALFGLAAAEKMWVDGFADPIYRIAWSTTQAQVADSGELGVTSGTFIETAKGPDGKIGSQSGKYLAVWKKDARGRWKVTYDIWNYDK